MATNVGLAGAFGEVDDEVATRVVENALFGLCVRELLDRSVGAIVKCER